MLNYKNKIAFVSQARITFTPLRTTFHEKACYNNRMQNLKLLKRGFRHTSMKYRFL